MKYLSSFSGQLGAFSKNSFWSVLGAFFSKGLNFIIISLIAKQLGPSLFGEYNVVQTTLGLFGTVSGLGLGLAATKLIAEWKGKDSIKVGKLIGTFYGMSMLISWSISLAFFFLSNWVAEHFFNNVNLTIYFQITSVIVVLDSLNGVQNGILSGFESFKKITTTNIILGIFTSPFLLIGSFYYGLLGLTIALLLTRLFTVLAFRFILFSEYKKFNVISRVSFDKEIVKSILKISIPSFLSSMTTNPINWLSTSLFVQQPGGYSNLGLFNAANQLKTLVLFLPDSAGRVAMPMMASSYGHQDFVKFKKTVLLTLISNILFSILPAIVVFLASGYIQVLFGVQYEFSNTLIIIVLLIGILIAITNAVGYIFICSNLVWFDFYIRLFWGVALVLLIYFYGRFNGASGYGLSVLGAEVVHLLSQFFTLLYFFYIRKIKYGLH